MRLFPPAGLGISIFLIHIIPPMHFVLAGTGLRRFVYFFLLAAGSLPLLAQSGGSIPSGSVRVTLAAGTPAAPATTAFALHLTKKPAVSGAASGRITAIGSASVSLASAGWLPGALATAAAPHAIRFTSGAAAGRLLGIVANTAGTLTLGGPDLATLGILAGDSFEVVPLETLNSLFGASMLSGGANPAAADIVHLGGQTRDSYYYNTAQRQWRKVSGRPVDAGQIALYPDAPILVSRTGAAVTLSLTGRVPSTPFRADVANAGNTYTHTGFPTDATLGSLALQSRIAGWNAATTAALADKVYIHADNAWRSYFYNGSAWLATSGDATSQDALALPAGSPLLIVRPGLNDGASGFVRPLPYSL